MGTRLFSGCWWCFSSVALVPGLVGVRAVALMTDSVAGMSSVAVVPGLAGVVLVVGRPTAGSFFPSCRRGSIPVPSGPEPSLEVPSNRRPRSPLSTGALLGPRSWPSPLVEQESLCGMFFSLPLLSGASWRGASSRSLPLTAGQAGLNGSTALPFGWKPSLDSLPPLTADKAGLNSSTACPWCSSPP